MSARVELSRNLELFANVNDSNRDVNAVKRM